MNFVHFQHLTDSISYMEEFVNTFSKNGQNPIFATFRNFRYILPINAINEMIPTRRFVYGFL